MYGTQYGFTAQQIESVMPDLVSSGKDGIKHLNTVAMIPLLVKAIKEQQLIIDSLKTKANKQDSINQVVQQQIASMLAEMRACCANSTIRNTGNTSNNELQKTANNSLDVELSDKNAVVLNQNVPNPFAEQTTITYNVPTNINKAKLLFYNNLNSSIVLYLM